MAEITISGGGYETILPVLPQGYTISTSQGNTSVTVSALGEVNLLGMPNLDTISFESFFPASAQSYSRVSISSPTDYVDRILYYKENGPVKLRLLDVCSVYCTVESFEYSEQDGTGDIYYSIELKRYRYINSAGLTNSSVSSIGRSDETVASSSTSSGGTYTVKTGDTLWSIARTQLGTSDWSELYEINADTIGSNPNSIYAGQVLDLPA